MAVPPADFLANFLSDVRFQRGISTDDVRDFDPTPQYLYDEPYTMLEFNEWLEEEYGL